MTDSIARVIVDVSGNIADIISDGGVNRLATTSVLDLSSSLPLPSGAATEATLLEVSSSLSQRLNFLGQKKSQDSTPVVIADNQTVIPVSIAGSVAAQGQIVGKLANTGSIDMVVDGSGTPVVFEYRAPASASVELDKLRLVLSAQALAFNGASFGKGGGALPNGVEINLYANESSFTGTLTTIFVNEDFFTLLDTDIFGNSGDAVVGTTLNFGPDIFLVSGSSDRIEVVIQDNLTAGTRTIYFFEASLFGETIS